MSKVNRIKFKTPYMKSKLAKHKGYQEMLDTILYDCDNNRYVGLNPNEIFKHNDSFTNHSLGFKYKIGFEYDIHKMILTIVELDISKKEEPVEHTEPVVIYSNN